MGKDASKGQPHVIGASQMPGKKIKTNMPKPSGAGKKGAKGMSGEGRAGRQSLQFPNPPAVPRFPKGGK